MDEHNRTPKDYLRLPYARVLTPDDEADSYTAEILEFPGCIAQGDSPEEAYERLENAAAGWIEAALDMGQEIPEPSDPYSYSGRVALRLPRSVHRRAAQLAERDGTSLNQFLVSAVAERVGAESLYARMVGRLEELTAPQPTVHVHVPLALTPTGYSLNLYERQESPITTGKPLAFAGQTGEN